MSPPKHISYDISALFAQQKSPAINIYIIVISSDAHHDRVLLIEMSAQDNFKISPKPKIPVSEVTYFC